jgi:NADH-quinone oxidoreductase subunit N
MFMAGIFFKLAVFPFHFWAPDVYEGSSNETTAYIASVPKLGAVAILLRVATLNPPGGEAVTWMLATLAVCSMFYGNLSALVQKDLKRMLAFSGIAHAGYFLFGLVIMKPEGYAYAIFYAVAYALMTLMCLLVVVKVSRDGENVAIADLAGLHKRSPLLAATLGVGMFALAGIPPFVGFMGKFLLLSGGSGKAWIVLVLLALVNTAIAIYYYLSVVRVTYCTDPEDKPAVALDTPAAVASVCLLVAVFLLGVVPGPVIELANAAIQTLF